MTAVAKLPEKWREDDDCSALEYAERLRCADELEAALSPAELGGVELPVGQVSDGFSGHQRAVNLYGPIRCQPAPGTKLYTTPRAAEAVSNEVRPCLWSQEDFESDCWVTSCGNAFSLNDGTPSDNSIKHCCYCGRHVAEELWVDPNEDDDDAALTPPSAKGE